MPTYNFECIKCGAKQEKRVPVFLGNGDKLLNDTPCPECGCKDWQRDETIYAPKIMGCTTPGPKN
jgi:predicted nucleic-acid-binding Zn-ribbon protein